MARLAASGVVCLLLAMAPAARGQPCGACFDNCACRNVLRPSPEPPDLAELRGVQAAAIATTVVSYVFSTAYAARQEHFLRGVDTIPVVGAISSAVRNQSRDAPLLLFSASTQVMGILVSVVAGLELAEERRRWEISVGGDGNGAGVMLGGHF
jgi:hypothetical protein